MRRRTNNITKDIIPAFTVEDRKAYAATCDVIIKAQAQAQARIEGMAETIAAELYKVRSRKLYMLDIAGSYAENQFTEWAVNTFGMSRGSISDAVNTFARFKAADSTTIAEKWRGYTFSTLMRMKNLSDADIERVGITENMSRSQVTQAIEFLEILKLEDSRKTDLDKKLKRAEKRFSLLAGNEFRVADEIINELIPGYTDRFKNGTRTVEDMEQSLYILYSMLRFWKNGKNVKTAEDYKIAKAEEEAEELIEDTDVKKEVLVVVDMQKDFIDGVLGTKEAEAIVENVVEKIRSFEGEVVFTRDTHAENYMDTQEGRKLPIPHCIKGSEGWKLDQRLEPLCTAECKVFDKPTFGSVELAEYLKKQAPDKITLIGLCTDICIISNAIMLKAFLRETEIVVVESCCAGVTPKSHKNALEAMKMCQINVV